MLKLLVPLGLIVAVSWSVFWMTGESLADQMSVSFTGLLTIVWIAYRVGSSPPAMSSLTSCWRSYSSGRSACLIPIDRKSFYATISAIMLTEETERLVLRDFRPGDFEAFYATSNSPEYQQFYAPNEITRTFWQDLFDRILASADTPVRTKYQLAVCLQTGELIGTCGVRIEVPEHQQASFGCAIGKAYWGQGLAYEAARHILDFGFSSLPIHRIFAETISENTRARALAERLGMRLEGKFRHHRFFRGRWWDTVIYAVLKEEWMRAT